jgi:hypothetical protein
MVTKRTKFKAGEGIAFWFDDKEEYEILKEEIENAIKRYNYALSLSEEDAESNLQIIAVLEERFSEENEKFGTYMLTEELAAFMNIFIGICIVLNAQSDDYDEFSKQADTISDILKSQNNYISFLESVIGTDDIEEYGDEDDEESEEEEEEYEDDDTEEAHSLLEEKEDPISELRNMLY